MRITVIGEVSTSIRNEDIANTLRRTTNAGVLNVGMKNPEQTPSLTHTHTSHMTVILLDTDSCSLATGGHGIGQGFLNGVLQFLGVVYDLIVEPLGAWPFSQINGGNCMSLPLNKGYGWVGSIDLEYIFEELFIDLARAGYPKERAKSQATSRQVLTSILKLPRKDFTDILKASDPEILRAITGSKDFMRVLADDGEKAKAVLELLGEDR